jgi:aminoglycoside N3'-acetyltransferase
MHTYSEAELANALDALGVRTGDVVHVHASLFALGAMRDVPSSAIPERVCRVLEEAVGRDGTITVPASFEDYARFGTPYDCVSSPVDAAQGVLSAHVARRPDAFRTFCPMSGVAGFGRLASDICHQSTGSGFGTGSAWDRLYVHDAKMLFLGVRPAKAFTFVVYIQSRFGVPYLYHKLYTVPTSERGNPVSLPITCAVRYLDRDYAISENCEPFEQRLVDEQALSSVAVGRGRVFMVPSARRAFDIGTDALKRDLYFFLAQPPRFVPGRIPTDGSTGAFVPDAVRFGVGPS